MNAAWPQADDGAAHAKDGEARRKRHDHHPAGPHGDAEGQRHSGLRAQPKAACHDQAGRIQEHEGRPQQKAEVGV